MDDNIRLICAGCGCCASHPEDRTERDRCNYCGVGETIIQERNADGKWIDAPGQVKVYARAV